MSSTLVTSLSALTGTYSLDPSHSRIGFIARHAMITKVRGSFNAYQGTATINGADPASSTLEVTIETASIDTRDENRDGHLKSPDFFDTENYPAITFVGKGFNIVDDATVEVTGDLTIKGVTRAVTVPFEFGGSATDPFGNDRIGFEGQVTINRKDWDLTWNALLETGGVLVGEKVVIELEVSAIKAA
jgi:polyisoprenoid-binding protein YceI